MKRLEDWKDLKDLKDLNGFEKKMKKMNRLALDEKVYISMDVFGNHENAKLGSDEAWYLMVTVKLCIR
jgi:hypothetical protein